MLFNCASDTYLGRTMKLSRSIRLLKVALR
jgi:hypothetical protein